MRNYSFFLYVHFYDQTTKSNICFLRKEIFLFCINSILLENLRGFILNQSIPEQLQMIRSIEH